MPSKQKLFKSNKQFINYISLNQLIQIWFKYQYEILLCLIILGAILLRFYHLNWDEGNIYHPDERNIDMAVMRVNIHHLNPHFFAYGALPIYLIRIIGDIVVLMTHNYSLLDSWNNINIISRFLSAAASAISVYIFYLIVKKAINKKMAVLGAFLMATSVGLIQYAHYGVTESVNILFLLLIIYLTLLFSSEQKLKYWLWLAIISGLALASKISNLIYMIIPISGLINLLLNHKLRKPFVYFSVLILLSLVVLFIFSPYNFLDYHHFITSIQYEGDVVSGKLSVPYTIQFSHTWPYFFSFINLHWQMGLLLPGLGLIGSIVWLIYILQRKEPRDGFVILFFGIIYFLYVGSWYTKFVRYMLPVIPILLLSALWLINRLLVNKKLQMPTKLLIFIIIVTNIIWVSAYSAIYRYPHPWITASKWIYQNIPAQSVLVSEEWDDRLPTYLPNTSPEQYHYLELKNFDEDSEDKIIYLADSISKADYIVLTSERVSGAITKNPQRYPLTNRYYQQLLQGQLGYKLVKTFSNYPRIGKLIINDEGSEETFRIYDHALVRIFKNSENLSKQELINRILAK